MLILALFAGGAVLGLAVWLLVTCCIHALPALVGLGAASLAYNSGIGPVGVGLVGLTAAALTLGIGRGLLAGARAPGFRTGLLVAFTVPAFFAGFGAMHDILAHVVPSGVLSFTLSGVGGTIIGLSARKQMGQRENACMP